MGLNTPDLPTMPADELLALPFRDRMRLLATHWAEWGFGSPRMAHIFYLLKLVLYVGGGFAIAWFTADLGSLRDGADWWLQPLFYEKILVWTVFFEIIGLGSSSGPLAFKFSPMIGGFLYLGRRKTLRIAPWPDRVPFTAGDHRTLWDVAVYWLLIANLVVLLAIGGDENAPFALLPGWLMLTAVALILIGGLRDKLVYLSSRSEQYLTSMLILGLFTQFIGVDTLDGVAYAAVDGAGDITAKIGDFITFTDLIVGLKIAICASWIGASFSKLTRFFSSVIPPMLSNTPWITSKGVKRSFYKDFPNDMRPSGVANFAAHVTGTLAEMGLPLVLLFSPWPQLTWVAIVCMILFHVFIISTFPLAVPLEWNVMFSFAAVWLFGWHHVEDGFGLGDGTLWFVVAMIAISVIFPIWGEMRPDQISFLPGFRQYSGNWASATWAFRDREKEERMNQFVVKASKNQLDQLVGAGFPEPVAEMFLQKAVAWRSMHVQGRALLSLIMRHADIETYTVREAEFICNSLIGWNFGDGHLHDERLINALQARCNYEPGDLVVAFTESQALHRKDADYRVIDAAVGVVERGTYVIRDASETQPWLPDGPIRHQVTWQLPGYQPPGEAIQGLGERGTPPREVAGSTESA
ncbi:MAG: DUF3556 domain-containing protein [Nocardioidaceae bacterium]|nr:DUF3556 domain-containing protein [Nocardioidaceae bacterium]